MARLVSGAFEEASVGEMSDYSAKAEVQIYDNISLEPKGTEDKSAKKGGVMDLDDDARAGLDSKYGSRSESCESLYIDPAEQAAAQVSILANPRRATIVESIEYLQEIGNSVDAGEELVVKRSESKVIMPTLAEGEDGDEEKSNNGSDTDLAPGKTENYAWNYATALDENDVTSHRHLVCVPKSLNSSVMTLLLFPTSPDDLLRELGRMPILQRHACTSQTTVKVGNWIFLGLGKTVDWSLVPS